MPRALAVIGGGTVTVRCPVRGRALRQMVIGGTVSKAIAIGEALRHARERGADPVAAQVQAAGGARLFEGACWIVWPGRTEADSCGASTGCAGRGRTEGHTLRVWLKNENEVSWRDDRPFVMTPDLLCAVEARTGQPFTNSQLREGLAMVVFGVPADPIWRTPEGLALTGPRHFGFDLPYRPMEEVLAGRGA